MAEMTLVLMSLPFGILIGVLAYGLWRRLARQTATSEAAGIRAEASAERDRILRIADVDAKEALVEMRRQPEQDIRRQKEELGVQEKRLRQRETTAERKHELVEKRERQLKKRQTTIEAEEQQVRQRLGDAQDRLRQCDRTLEEVAGLTRESARSRLVSEVEQEARREAAQRVRCIEEAARKEAKEKATQVVAEAMQRLGSEFVSEKTVSVVQLPSDDMKGRIIGREGRNIRAIEAATGVDVIIDDTPEVVVVSAFNPVRREIAKLALERLIADGRIHPAHIEEVVARVREEMEENIARAGEQATFELGLHGVHPELLRLVGRLKYRTVNGQNLWNHSVETATIAGMLASELGVNGAPAKRAGLLHEIGKAVEHEVEGHHATIAADLARKHGEKAEVVSAIRHHHGDDPPTVLAMLLQVADVVSRARPGARKETLSSHIKRLEDMERISLGFHGVQQAFALQAGREVRVMVDFAEVSTDEALMLSHDIVRRIQDELTYPGEIRVMVIREARATEMAR